MLKLLVILDTFSWWYTPHLILLGVAYAAVAYLRGVRSFVKVNRHLKTIAVAVALTSGTVVAARMTLTSHIKDRLPPWLPLRDKVSDLFYFPVKTLILRWWT